MADVRAFHGLRFNPAKTGSYDAMITPPYDVINPEMREHLAALSPYNMVHITLPRERDTLTRYEVATELFESWIADSVMVPDETPSFYLVEQRFNGLDGRPLSRRGFFAVCRIPEAGDESTVRKHERTFQSKVEDRLRLTMATQANLGPVFVLYDDPEGQLLPFFRPMEEREPDVTAHTVDGCDQRVWRVDDDPRVTSFFEHHPLYIADGHHRYATAVACREQFRAANGNTPGAHDFVLMGFVEMKDPGLVVWPTHRLLDLPADHTLKTLLDSLAPWFDVAPVSNDLVSVLDATPGCAFGLVTSQGDSYLVSLKPDADRAAFLGTEEHPVWRGLDVAVLHRGVFERILGLAQGAELLYEPVATKALERVRNGEKSLAFLMKAATPEIVRDCADNGVFMPQKATYFFPKLPTGAVVHRLI